jgi:hypothetical protein
MTSKRKLAVGVRFRQGGKLRPFHADVGAAAMAFTPTRSQASPACATRVRAGGLVETDVRHHCRRRRTWRRARACGRRTGPGSEIERRKIFAQRAHRADRDDALDAEHLHRADIGAIIDFAGRDERWPRPCRARNATRWPSSVPITMASEGSPNGVFTRTSRVCVRPGMCRGRCRR